MKWTVKLLVCTEQANLLCKAHFNQAHKNSGLWLNWTRTGSTWNRNWDNMRIKMVGQIAGWAICGIHSCCGLALWYGYSTDTKSRYLSLVFPLRKMMLTTLTHASQLPPPHTPTSTGYPWSPAWAARVKTCVFYVRLITLHATISHPVSAASFEYRSYLDYQFFLLCRLWCPCFHKAFGTKMRRDHINAVWFWGFQNVPALSQFAFFLLWVKSWGCTSQMCL